MDKGWTVMTVIFTSIIGLAVIAVIISQRANTAAIIQAGASGLSNVIGAAVKPVSG